MNSPTAPTLDEVAQAAGVSRSTASRAINGGLRVSPEAQAAVDDAVARLGYTPNRAARSLVTRRTDSIALVVPEPDERILTDPFLAGTMRGVSAALGGTDLQLVLLFARPDEQPGHIVRYLRSGHVDGAIVASHHRDDELEEAMLSTRMPAVFVGRPFRATPDLLYVDVDNVEGGRLAARRLVAAGRRRLATIAGPQDMTAGVDRLLGWHAELEASGLSGTAVAHGDFALASGAAAMEQLLVDHPDIDGLFAASDLMAEGAMRVLARHGRRVPQDVAVVGFDDLATASATSPPLTTIRNPMIEMARDATNMLLDLVVHGKDEMTSRVLSPDLVERASV